MKSRKTQLLFILIWSLCFCQSVFSQSNFRILPYLQINQQKVQIRWFSGQNLASNLIITDPSGATVFSGAISGTEVSELYYTQAEKSQSISGLPIGSWIGSDKYFRYEKSLTLQAGKTYLYTVTLNGQNYSSSFKTAPALSDWESIRFVALSDSETEPRGRVTNRAWYPGKPLFRLFPVPAAWKAAFGTTVEENIELPNYMLTEQKGFAENLKILKSRNPDFVLMPGDLVQGGAYMPGWDEFWRHTSGEFDQVFDKFPIIPAIGNWEAFGAVSGGYGFNERGSFNPVLGRSRFHRFFEFSSEDPDQNHRQSYYRTDYGPITILTLDSSNGTPEQKRSDFSDAQKVKNKELTEIGTDTQENYTQAEYNAAGGSDLSGFGPGTPQYQWLEKNLQQAQAQGQLIFVQFHHIPYSSGEHGVPINHELATGQEGVPMRVLNPILEQYGVIAVFAGHDELFERSFVDADGDGKGIHYYDVGVAGDGMRGVKRNWLVDPINTLDYNSFSKWTADQSSSEVWDNSGANPVLLDGGKHYGHLEVNLKKVQDGGKTFAQIDFEPIYAFPVMNAQYQLQRVERRVYADPVRIMVELKTAEPTVVPQFKTNLTVELSAQGNFQTKASDFLTNSVQADWTFTYSRSLLFTCVDLGVKEITVTVKNAQNQEWSGKVAVTVLDKIAPDFEATDAFLAFDKVLGKVTLDPESFYIRQEFITENCLNNGGVSIDFDRRELTCVDLTGNPIPIKITVTDRSGNATSKTRKVTLNPIESKKISISPVDAYQGIAGETVELQLGDEFGYAVDSWIKDGQVIVGEKSKTLRVTQSGTYFARVIPTGGCQVESRAVTVNLLVKPYGPLRNPVELNLNSTGKATLSPAQVFVTWPLADATLSVTLSKTEFTCADLGEKDVTVTIKNQTGQTWTETAKVKVQDKEAPVLVTRIPSLSFDRILGVLELNADNFVSSVSDNCGIKSVTLNKPRLTCTDLGAPIEVILTATDQSGNVTSKTVSFTPTIQESKKLSISPASSYQGIAGETVELQLGEEFGYAVESWIKDGQVIAGEKLKTLRVTQSGTYFARVIPTGGCQVESRAVTVNLLVKPYGPLRNPVELNLNATGKATLSPAQVFVTWPLTDATLSVTLSKTEFSCSDLGEKDVTVTIKNQTGQTWTETAKVKVQDKEAPVLVTRIPTLSFDRILGVLELNADNFVSSVSDNCGIKSVTLNKPRITCTDLGAPIEVILTATDQSGNVTSKTVSFTPSIQESKKLSISPANSYQGIAGETVELNLGEEFGYTVDSWIKDGQVIAGEKSKTLRVTQSGTYFARVIPTGGCQVESRAVTVNLLVKPYGPMRNPVELNLNATGKATLSPAQVFVTWPLADASLTVTLSKTEFTCADLGEKEVTVTIKNQTGQTWTETAKVKVQDKEAPVLVTRIPTLSFDRILGVLELKADEFVSSVSDNCGIKSVTLNKPRLTCTDLGAPIEVILTATDQSGNVTSKTVSFTPTIQESKKLSISPASSYQGIAGETVELQLGEEFGYAVESWIKDGQVIAGEKSKTLRVTQSGTYFARVIPTGGCQVESRAVTVNLLVKPYGPLRNPVELTLNATGKATLSPAQVFVTWPLADASLTVILSKTEFTCADLGEKEVTVTIKNQTGQTWTETAKVKVQDKEAPVLVSKDYVLDYDVQKGPIELKPENFLASILDNCTINQVTISKNTATCEDLGKEFSLAIRAVDGSGNVAEATAKLTVRRLEATPVSISGPTQFCQGEKGTLTLTSSASFEVVRWRRNGVEIPGQTGKTLEVSEPGKYHAVIRYAGGCLSESVDVEIKVNPLPSGEILVDGNILRAPEGNFTYQWFRNGEKLSGATARVLTVDSMGEYSVELTSASGCVARLKSVTVTVSGLGGNWVKPPVELILFPNPASVKIQLLLPNDALLETSAIQVYSLEGKKVTEMVSIVKVSETQAELGIFALPSGTYLVWILGDSQNSYLGKFVVLK